MSASPWQCPLLLKSSEATPVLVCSLSKDCAPIMLTTLGEAIAFYYRALSAGAKVAVFPSEANLNELKHHPGLFIESKPASYEVAFHSSSYSFCNVVHLGKFALYN